MKGTMKKTLSLAVLALMVVTVVSMATVPAIGSETPETEGFFGRCNQGCVGYDACRVAIAICLFADLWPPYDIFYE